MNDSLQQLIADVLGVAPEQITRSSNQKNLEEWDSMAQVNLSSALEGEYGITLSTADMAKLTSVEAIVTLLQQRGRL